MADVFKPPFGGYNDLTRAISVGLNNDVQAMLDQFTALFASTTGSGADKHGLEASHPDFDLIHPETKDKIINEIAGIKAAMDAGLT